MLISTKKFPLSSRSRPTGAVLAIDQSIYYHTIVLTMKDINILYFNLVVVGSVVEWTWCRSLGLILNASLYHKTCGAYWYYLRHVQRMLLSTLFVLFRIRANNGIFCACQWHVTHLSLSLIENIKDLWLCLLDILHPLIVKAWLHTGHHEISSLLQLSSMSLEALNVSLLQEAG